MINLLLVAIFFFLFTKQYIGFVRTMEPQRIYFFHKSKSYQKNQWILCRIEGETIVGKIQYQPGDKVPLKNQAAIANHLNGDFVPEQQYVVCYTYDGKKQEVLCHVNNIIGLVNR